jgi:hypothetical protein
MILMCKSFGFEEFQKKSGGHASLNKIFGGFEEIVIKLDFH